MLTGTKQQKGFTLVEITIVMLVIGLLLGGFLKMAGVQREQTKRDETRLIMNDIKQALQGYVATNGRLPCPDTDGDGQENPLGGPNPGQGCTADGGFLPFVDIGTGNVDAWNNRFRYRVTGNAAAVPGAVNFADRPAVAAKASFNMADVGDIVVRDANAVLIANNLPVVIVSFANNGGRTIPQIVCGAGVPSATESENCDDDTDFIYDSYRVDYDDLVAWIPTSVLKSAMINARRLP